MKIENFRRIENSYRVGSFNIVMENWGGLIIRDCHLFCKDGKEWISLPQKEYMKNGEKKYYTLISFSSYENLLKFLERVKQEVKKIMGNPEPIISDDSEIPF